MQNTVKGFTLVLCCLWLGGCASYIANKITHAETPAVQGNSADWTEMVEVCDTNAYCIETISVNRQSNTFSSLTFDFKINDTHRVWRYDPSRPDEEPVDTPEPQLIVIFAGYSQPARILLIQQLWLERMTGADVMVIPSAEISDQFRFGLDYISPIKHEIKLRAPEKVHVVGFSMGALAAQAVAEEIDNARLYLVAPMTDFAYATKAIWNIAYRDKLNAAFVSENTIDEAIQLIYEEADKTAEDTDLLTKLRKTSVPTFIYASRKDRVIDIAGLEHLVQENVRLKTYKQLNHIEMLALVNQTLLSDFASDLLERHVSERDVEIIGSVCDASDMACLKDIQEINKKGE